MCRIAGFWDFSYADSYPIEKVALKMRDSLTHGGPDDAGIYIEKESGVVLTHRRLSIIDLSPMGHQPMKYDNLVITYNGEVYNYKEIRKELEEEGYVFVSNSDTEVLLKAFHRWGFDAVHRFRGMFAFAIWDKREKRLILCRDRVGVKPLYYFFDGSVFMFSSELKAFHIHPKFRKELSLEALALYLQYGYITSPFSIFKNTYKLEPGHFIIVRKDRSIEKVPYWRLEDYYMKKPLRLSLEEAVQELESLLVESFKLRLVADVPVGLFLSGGIDSTTVVALLQKEVSRPIKTFTIGFYEQDYNEAHYAKKIAEYLGTDHTELYCTPSEAYEVIPKLPEIYDEPFGDPSAIPTYLVSSLARNQVKVALSADGGDEQFCGYARYWLVRGINKKLKKIGILSPILANFLRLINPEIAFRFYKTFNFLFPRWTNFRDKYNKLRNVLMSPNLENQYDTSNKIFIQEDLTQLVSDGLSSIDHLDLLQHLQLKGLNFMMFYDLKTYLPDDILVKVDRATMSVALEGREPLLDHKLIEFTSNLPEDLKYKNGTSKYILRKILYKYVPKELVDRPKMGFGVPIYEWFKNELKKLYKEYLDEEKIKKIGVLNPEYVKEILNSYFEDRGVNHNKLWLIFCFQSWAEKWLC